MSDKRVWVRVNKTDVEVVGSKMPKERRSDLFYFYAGRNDYSRKDFAEWFGVTFPKGEGVYGLVVKMARIERYRVVEEKDYVAAERITHKMVKVE